jgi:hypothetical protein
LVLPKKHRNLNPKKRGNRAASKTARVQTVAALTVASRSHRAAIVRPAAHHQGKALRHANLTATASNRGKPKSRIPLSRRLTRHRQQQRHPPRRRHLPPTARVSSHGVDRGVGVEVAVDVQPTRTGRAVTRKRRQVSKQHRLAPIKGLRTPHGGLQIVISSRRKTVTPLRHPLTAVSPVLRRRQLPSRHLSPNPRPLKHNRHRWLIRLLQQIRHPGQPPNRKRSPRNRRVIRADAAGEFLPAVRLPRVQSNRAHAQSR